MNPIETDSAAKARRALEWFLALSFDAQYVLQFSAGVRLLPLKEQRQARIFKRYWLIRASMAHWGKFHTIPRCQACGRSVYDGHVVMPSITKCCFAAGYFDHPYKLETA